MPEQQVSDELIISHRAARNEQHFCRAIKNFDRWLLNVVLNVELRDSNNRRCPNRVGCFSRQGRGPREADFGTNTIFEQRDRFLLDQRRIALFALAQGEQFHFRFLTRQSLSLQKHFNFVGIVDGNVGRSSHFCDRKIDGLLSGSRSHRDQSSSRCNSAIVSSNRIDPGIRSPV